MSLLAIIADEQDRVILRQLVHVFPEVILACIATAREVRLAKTDRFTEVNNNGFILAREFFNTLCENRGTETGAMVVGCEGSHVDRTVRTVERRSLREIKFINIVQGKVSRNSGGNYINKLVYSDAARNMCAEYPA